MLEPDPIAMLAGVLLFVAVLVALVAVTAVRRRGGVDVEVRPPADPHAPGALPAPARDRQVGG